MDSIRASEAPDTGSIPVEATAYHANQLIINSINLFILIAVHPAVHSASFGRFY